MVWGLDGFCGGSCRYDRVWVYGVLGDCLGQEETGVEEVEAAA